MPNRTIYITAPNDKKLEAEPNVSGLINVLLNEYFTKHVAEGQGK